MVEHMNSETWDCFTCLSVLCWPLFCCYCYFPDCKRRRFGAFVYEFVWKYVCLVSMSVVFPNKLFNKEGFEVLFIETPLTRKNTHESLNKVPTIETHFSHSIFFPKVAQMR